MTELFPAIEPYETTFLDVGDGHRVFVEQAGNPDGKPVVYLHGGPGAGNSAALTANAIGFEPVIVELASPPCAPNANQQSLRCGGRRVLGKLDRSRKRESWQGQDRRR